MAINSVDNDFSFLNKGAVTEAAEEKDSGALAMEDFMSLMTTQLQNQDPMKPMESGDFLGQIASFGTVSGIDGLQKSFEGFSKSMQSDQALQGSSLVGRSVLVPSSVGVMTTEEGLKGQINVSQPVHDLSVQVFTEAGALVKTINIGQASGYTNFSWNGTSENGEVLNPGTYKFKASGTIEGENRAFGTATVAKVDSVLVGSGSQGLTMNLAGLGSVPFSEAQEII